MVPMRVLAKPDNMIDLDPVNGTNLQVVFGFFLFVTDFFVFDHVWILRFS